MRITTTAATNKATRAKGSSTIHQTSCVFLASLDPGSTSLVSTIEDVSGTLWDKLGSGSIIPGSIVSGITLGFTVCSSMFTDVPIGPSLELFHEVGRGSVMGLVVSGRT